MVQIKYCPRCSSSKSLELFSNEKKQKDGRAGYCKECMKEYGRARILPESYKIRAKAKYEETKNDPALLEERRKYAREYAASHRRDRGAYFSDNRERIQLHRKKPAQVVARRSRRRLLKAVGRNLRWIKTADLIGCTPKFHSEYLEAKFKKGMTWADCSKWHIDHIRPCSSFDLSDVSQIKECFHYSNTQPLWAKENEAKGNSYTPF